MRKTKIICTIGPVSQSKERLRELMLAGMNVCRFNFSHGDHAEQKEKLENVIAVREELGLPIATLLDTKGPEIRIGDLEGGRAELRNGQSFVLTAKQCSLEPAARARAPIATNGSNTSKAAPSLTTTILLYALPTTAPHSSTVHRGVANDLYI